MKEPPTRLQSITNLLSILLGALFIAYCIIYLVACPSPSLAAAVCAEVIALIISVIIIRTNLLVLPKALTQKFPEAIRKKLKEMQHYINCCKIVILSLVTAMAATDFVALTLSMCGLYAPAIVLFTSLPATYWMGLHPGFSLEMLAGALVQNKSYEKAEPLYKEIMAIRIKISGADSDLASAIYADLGDLYVRKNDLKTAEKWYRRTVAIGARTGRGYTALATVLREQGHFAESKEYYLKALALREKLFGTTSKQYNDTKRGYTRLQSLMGEIETQSNL